MAVPKRTFAILDALARDPSITLEAKGLWRLLDSYADPDGTSSFPGIGTLCQIGRCDRKRIFRLIADLEASGWLIVSRRTGAANGYRLVYQSQNGTGSLQNQSQNGTATSPKTGTLPHISTPEAKKRFRSMSRRKLADLLFDPLNPGPNPPRERNGA